MQINRYFHNILTLLLTRGAGIFLSLLISLYIARYYGAGTTGKYYLFISILTGLSIISKLGFNSSLIKYCAQYSASKEKESIRGYWYSALKISLYTSAILITLIILAQNITPLSQIFDDTNNLLTFVCISLVPFTLLGHNVAVLIGLNKQNIATVTENVAPPFLFLSISIALYLITPEKEMILYIYTISITIVFFISTYILWDYLHSKKNTVTADSKKLIKTSRPILVINITNFLTDWGATFILGVFGTLQQIGVYNISWRLVTITGILILVFNNINAPKYSKDFKDNNIESIDKTARQTSLILFMIGLPTTIIIMLYPEYILSLFGNDFISGALILQILAIGQLFNFVTGSVGYLLLMTGHEKKLKTITMYICTLQIIAMVIFIPTYDIYAAAIITSTAITIKSVLSVYIAYKNIGALSLPIPRKKTL